MGLFDAINSIFGSSAGQKAAEQAQQANIAALNTYSGKANDLFNQYKTSSLGSLGEGLTGSLGELDKATGAVTTMFRNQPGYQFQQDEAARAIAANAAKLGISASGNTLQTLGDRSQNIANTGWNDYLTRLGAFVPLQQQGATALGAGLTGANKTLADIFSSGGQALAGVYGANAAQTAGIEGQYGQNQVDVFGNTVQGKTQVGRDVSQGTLASNNAVAQAKQQHAANNMGFWASLA